MIRRGREAHARRVKRLLAALLLLSLAVSSCARRHGPLAYVSNERAGTVSVIDTTTDSVVSTIKVGARARGIHLSPDGGSVWVALSYQNGHGDGEDKIAAIDTRSERIAAKY